MVAIREAVTLARGVDAVGAGEEGRPERGGLLGIEVGEVVGGLDALRLEERDQNELVARGNQALEGEGSES